MTRSRTMLTFRGNRFGYFLVFGTFLFLMTRVLIAMGENSLWIDEILTMSMAYNSPGGFWHWIYVLNSGENPHFPTLYVFTRGATELVKSPILPLEYFVRLPSFALMVTPILFALVWSLVTPRDTGGVLLALMAMLALVIDPAWREHSAEARMYGIMSAGAVAVVVALYRDRYVAAALCGLAIVSLHPFGLMLGFAPVALVLVLPRDRISHWTRSILATASIIMLALAGYWTLMKFIWSSSDGFTAVGGSDDIAKVLAGINAVAFLGACALVGLAALYARRRDRSTWPRLAGLTLILLSIMGFVIALLIMRPTTPPYPRYATWVNPALLVICSVALITLAETACMSFSAMGWHAAAAGLAGLAIYFGAAHTFGPPWGNGLRQAAAYVNSVATGTDVVTHDSYEMVFVAPPYRTGFHCERGGQVIGYLSERLRYRAPCQAGEVVAIGPDVERVFLVREPIAWAGPRRIDLEAFRETETLRFDNASVDVFDRVKP
jgi:hypothetical protein